MLRLMLTCHPHIGIPPEGGFVVALGWLYGRRRAIASQEIPALLAHLFAHPNTVDWNLEPDELRRRLSALTPCRYPRLVDEIYRTYLDNKFPGKRRWGDKTTGLVDHVRQLDEYFADALFIHLIRDGRAVAASYMRVPHLSSEPTQIAFEWRRTVQAYSRFGRRVGPQRFHELRYEDLVEDPEGELRRICSFVGEPYSPQMLGFASKNRDMKLEPERHLGWKGLTLRTVTAERRDSWRGELAPQQVQSFEGAAGDVLARYGYLNASPGHGANPILGAKRAVFYLMRAAKSRTRPIRHRSRALVQD